MTCIPHDFLLKKVFESFGITLPRVGEYAVGNLFFNPDQSIMQESKDTFQQIARDLGLVVLCWREVPRNSDILGPVSRGKEPLILQPFVTMARLDENADLVLPNTFDSKLFKRQLYLLRKKATHQISLKRWFYVCSLSERNLVYKGQLSPVQVYDYFPDLCDPSYKSHFCLVHSRFSTNTFPSWDRAQPMRWCAHNGRIAN
jgi:glutamate synthase (NADPH/NADH)